MLALLGLFCAIRGGRKGPDWSYLTGWPGAVLGGAGVLTSTSLAPG